MILIIDNYDSFTHNLARYVECAGEQTHIVRNDEITVDDALALRPTGIILSPGPCTPNEAGICKDLILAAHKTIPILGVCLGHQCIGEVFGSKTVRSDYPTHGRASLINTTQSKLFKNIPNPLKVGRYHSLVTQGANLEITAKTNEGEIMAMEHKDYPTYGIQFHPESILTEHGHTIIQNFIEVTHENMA